MSAKHPVATLDESATEAQRELVALEIPDNLPPSNEELEAAVQSAGLYNAAMRYIKPMDGPIMEQNRITMKLHEREKAKAKADHDQNLKDGIPDDDFMWPEEPSYLPTTSYTQFVQQLSTADRTRVLVEVARNRARRGK